MNQFLGARYDEHIERLAIGLEPIDAQRGVRVGQRLRIALDQTAIGFRRPPVQRHDTCLFALRYAPGLTDPVTVRLFDAPRLRYTTQGDRRRFVPRRLQIPLVSAAVADGQPASNRIRRPALFPGAAYDVSESATGLRGRALHNNQPLRWARLQATLIDGVTIVGRAHGDDRGEFLLLIAAAAMPQSDLVEPLPLVVTVFGPNPPPVPATPGLPAMDPLWDLPLEVVPAAGLPDPVSAGEVLPPNYTASSSRNINFSPGSIVSGVGDFVI
jgi:hypothetical protein